MVLFVNKLIFHTKHNISIRSYQGTATSARRHWDTMKKKKKITHLKRPIKYQYISTVRPESLFLNDYYVTSLESLEGKKV